MNQKSNSSNKKRSKIILILFIFVLVFLGYLLLKLFSNSSAPIAAQQKAIQQTSLVKVVEQAKLSNSLQHKSKEMINKNGETGEGPSTLYNTRSNELSLAKINTALLTEQATQQKLKAQIAQSESQMGLLMHPYVNANTQQVSSSFVNHEVKPSVIWIAMKNGQVIASIRQSNNNIVIVHEGMILPDGTQIRSIDKDSVILIKGEKVQKLILPADYYE
jgi:type IV pilus biogenesis protein PilP